MFTLVPHLFAVLLSLGDPTLPEIEAKDLPKVSGPISLEYGDPVGRAHDFGIRRQARKAPPLTRRVEAQDAVVKDIMNEQSGRVAYEVTVPPRTHAHARLRGVHEAWFRMTAVNRMGQLDASLTRNVLMTGNPEAFCDNRGDKPVTIYFVVDTTEPQVFNEPFQVTFLFQPKS